MIKLPALLLVLGFCFQQAQAAAKPCSCKDTAAAPVCGTNDVSYRNACEAKCAGAKVAYKKPCGASKKACNKCDTFLKVWDPVCLTQATAVKGGPKPWTYANPCYAACTGKATPVSPYYKAVCKPSCDAKCAKAGAAPVCCDGVEYPNSCYAGCVGGLADAAMKKCYSGLCTGGDTIQLMSGCPEGGRMAKCMNTCAQGAPCSTAPDVECVVTSCDRFFRFTGLTICKPAWVNKTSSQLLACK